MFYRIDISSIDTVSITPNAYDNDYFIDLPLLDDVEYQFAVESFVLNYSTPSAFSMELVPLYEKNSYTTTSKSTSSRVFQSANPSYYVPVETTTVWHYVPNNDYFRSKRFNIRFRSTATGTIMTSGFGVSPAWSATLVVYPINK